MMNSLAEDLKGTGVRVNSILASMSITKRCEPLLKPLLVGVRRRKVLHRGARPDPLDVSLRLACIFGYIQTLVFCYCGNPRWGRLPGARFISGRLAGQSYLYTL